MVPKELRRYVGSVLEILNFLFNVDGCCLQTNKQAHVFRPFLFSPSSAKSHYESSLFDAIFSSRKRLRFLSVVAVVEAGKGGRRLSELLKLIPNVSSKCQRSEARVVRFT